jgi:hypothetical protein
MLAMSVLEFISSLKWPIVVLVVLAWASRAPNKHPDLARRLAAYLDRRDIRGKAGPVEFEAITPAAIVQAAAASDDELAVLAAEDQDSEEETRSRPDLSILRREVVEQLLHSSAQWGWEMAQLGFRTPPDPQVRWTDDGRPEILYGREGPVSRAVVVPREDPLPTVEVKRRASLAEAIRRHYDDDQPRES